MFAFVNVGFGLAVGSCYGSWAKDWVCLKNGEGLDEASWA